MPATVDEDRMVIDLTASDEIDGKHALILMDKLLIGVAILMYLDKPLCMNRVEIYWVYCTADLLLLIRSLLERHPLATAL